MADCLEVSEGSRWMSHAHSPKAELVWLHALPPARLERARRLELSGAACSLEALQRQQVCFLHLNCYIQSVSSAQLNKPSLQGHGLQLHRRQQLVTLQFLFSLSPQRQGLAFRGFLALHRLSLEIPQLLRLCQIQLKLHCFLLHARALHRLQLGSQLAHLRPQRHYFLIIPTQERARLQPGRPRG